MGAFYLPFFLALGGFGLFDFGFIFGGIWLVS
jgi:hypothetical protein